MPITPMDIRKKAFSNQLRGWAPAEVRAFLELVATEMEELRRERALLSEKVDELSARLETYAKTERLLQDTLVTAQKATDELHESARRSADSVLAEAQAKAEELVRKAQADVRQVQEQLRELKVTRSNLVDEIKGVCQTYLAMADRHDAGHGTAAGD